MEEQSGEIPKLDHAGRLGLGGGLVPGDASLKESTHVQRRFLRVNTVRPVQRAATSEL